MQRQQSKARSNLTQGCNSRLIVLLMLSDTLPSAAISGRTRLVFLKPGP